MNYLYEVHWHTSEVSYCSCITAPKGVELLMKSGYAGGAVTNHYYREWFTDKKDLTWDEKVDLWLSGYRAAKKEGDACGFPVSLGMELRFVCRGMNDYLVYGLDEDFVRNHPNLYDLTPEQFYRLARQHNLFFSQAHPMRHPCSPESPDNLDGMEVFNGHPGHNSNNPSVYHMVSGTNLIPTVGSDFHGLEQLGACGMLFDMVPTNSAELASRLLNRKIAGYYIRDLNQDADYQPFQQDSHFSDSIIRK